MIYQDGSGNLYYNNGRELVQAYVNEVKSQAKATVNNVFTAGSFSYWGSGGHESISYSRDLVVSNNGTKIIIKQEGFSDHATITTTSKIYSRGDQVSLYGEDVSYYGNTSGYNYYSNNQGELFYDNGSSLVRVDGSKIDGNNWAETGRVSFDSYE